MDDAPYTWGDWFHDLRHMFDMVSCPLLSLPSHPPRTKYNHTQQSDAKRPGPARPAVRKLNRKRR